MKQSKFSLADVVNVLTALAFGFICFLGKNFYTLGNTFESINWAAIITVSLAGTAFIAKLLKRTSRNFKTCFILEMVVLLLFTGLTVFFTYSTFPHYFNVSANKIKIQNKLQTSITQAENMFAEYENYVKYRESNYKGKLQSVVATMDTGHKDYLACGFISGSVPDSIQIDHKMFTIHKLLFPSNYKDSISKRGIKEVATTWLKNSDSIISNWSPIGIVNVVNTVEKNSEDWRSQLIGFSKEHGECEVANPFEYELSFDDVKLGFTTCDKPTQLSIGLAVGAYLLMLFSYLISKRSSKTTICTTKKNGAYDID